MIHTEAEVFTHRSIRTKEEVGDKEDLDSEQRHTANSSHPFASWLWTETVGGNTKGGGKVSEKRVRDFCQQFYAAQGGELVLHTRKRAAGIALPGQSKRPH